jgi:hypothetical protein
MNSTDIRKSLQKLTELVSFKYPATGWYFSPQEIEDSFVFKKDKWVCMFMYWKMVFNKGKRVRFSDDNNAACTGIAEYGGFKELEDDEGHFIAEVERFKRSKALAKQYHNDSLQVIHPPKEKYLYFERIDSIADSEDIEVVNLYPDTTGLASLTVFSSYDRETNWDNVIAPFASGCQSVFSIPYNEGFSEKPKSVIGLMDHLVRNFIPDDMLAFSVPAKRFFEMVNNIEGSFLDKNFDNPTGF